jgi:hypothetical protein
MRIHLPLHPAHFGKDAAAGGSGPFARIGGELVVIELQGELTWEGDNANGVVGVLGLDRPVSGVQCCLRDTITSFSNCLSFPVVLIES